MKLLRDKENEVDREKPARGEEEQVIITKTCDSGKTTKDGEASRGTKPDCPLKVNPSGA